MVTSTVVMVQASLDDVETSPAGAILDTIVQPALNLFIFNRQINTGAMLRMLRQEGAFRELAEPNLIAMNGQQASFLAGGEFPVPVLQNAAAAMAASRSFGKNMAFA